MLLCHFAVFVQHPTSFHFTPAPSPSKILFCYPGESVSCRFIQNIYNFLPQAFLSGVHKHVSGQSTHPLFFIFPCHYLFFKCACSTPQHHLFSLLYNQMVTILMRPSVTSFFMHSIHNVASLSEFSRHQQNASADIAFLLRRKVPLSAFRRETSVISRPNAFKGISTTKS